ncbi:hypothetical protein BDV12DRAFT_180679 [Aspergillus spectabilis]
MGAAAQLDNFELFPLLPTEIRLLIWRMARHGRVVEITPELTDRPACFEPNSPYRQAIWTRVTRMHISGSPPAGLLINRESRAEMLSSYKLVTFPDEHDASGATIPTAKFYFEPEIDTLRLSTRCLCHDTRGEPYVAMASPDVDPVLISCVIRPLMVSIEGDIQGFHEKGLEIPKKVPGWTSWPSSLCHLTFDAALLCKTRSLGRDMAPVKSVWGALLESLVSRPRMIRTVTITMVSIQNPLCEARQFPHPGESDATQAYNVSAVRIARRPPAASLRDPNLRRDGAMLYYTDHHHGTSEEEPFAIFELFDEEQRRLFNCPSGKTALARRVDWLMRAAPHTTTSLWNITPNSGNELAFRSSISSDVRILINEWMARMDDAETQRLPAVCHGVCMPDYGYDAL